MKLQNFTLGVLLIFSLNQVAMSNTNNELLAELLNVYSSGKNTQFKSLVLKNTEQIVEAFPKWLVVPESIRNDREKASNYANMIISIINIFNEKGDSRLTKIAGIEDQSNPINSWPDALQKASELLDHNPNQSIEILEPYVNQYQNRPGTAVDEYMCKTLGIYGVAYFRAGSIDKSISYLEKATTECKRTGDLEGASLYASYVTQIKEMSKTKP